MRFCWLKDAVFTVNALHKIQAISQMEAYISYLINICILSIKKDLAIETSYALIYNKGRRNEREATNLAGYAVSTIIVINLANNAARHTFSLIHFCRAFNKSW